MSTSSTGKRTALYLYGIIRACDATELGPIGLEVNGSQERVFPILVDDVGAVVSHFPVKGRVMPVRKNLDAQNRVLRHLMNTPGGVLPIRFGHVVPGEDEVRRILTARKKELTHQLARLAGKVEMALKVYWDVPNVFDYLVQQDSTLSTARDELFADGGEPSRDELIELGRLFAARLDEERRTHSRLLTEALADVAVEITEDPAQGETMIASLALLVERSRIAELDARVHEVAGRLPDAILFKMTGPFAPFHFVTLNLDDDDGEDHAS